MTPEELDLLAQAAEAAKPGVKNAALRIELFPKMIELTKRVIQADRSYRPHRREISVRVKRVKTAMMHVREKLEDPMLGAAPMSELLAALRDLNDYLMRLD